ncbi:Sucraseferredoxin-like protein [Suhomyces tanzawaensis NRRL Y-17324]|uniref:Sucraseferredoxin-like protein n=1 Tax=Suhomyces tanzawaensis NRRL Y-17324 TaxID=984487 RepID=A0A1E4SBW1_9ASCO|nr:Sucraseferredoxin-like protein [Suhomyces tanzawaensis NRRL Y-17324]ODV77020.1 Sucraseferredoxin-like protein [Suhomyces tanzawaensis NRRL Y-17324]
MGLLNWIAGGPDVHKKMADTGFDSATCDFDCGSCHSEFPKSLKIEQGTIFGSTKDYGVHLMVATGKTDWPHDATGVSHTLAHAVALWAGHNSSSELGPIKTTVSSLCTDELFTNPEYISEARGDVLVLPFFVWIRNLAISDVKTVMSTVVQDLASARKDRLKAPQLSYPQFPDIRLELDTNRAHIILCSHRTRDKRCGITAPIMKKEMEIYLREQGLLRDHGDPTPGGVKVSFTNHIGQHKFAANVIIYLRNSGKNIWLARCTPNNVRPIIDECVLNDGKVWPDHVRLLQQFEPIDW